MFLFKKKTEFELLLEQAQEGDVIAIYNVGATYRDALDYVRPKEWFEKAAAKGNADAQNMIGQLYGEGKDKNILVSARRC